MQIIGISGKIGTGKTTLACLLEEEMLLYRKNTSLKRTAFADLLKKEAADIYGFGIKLAYSFPGKKTLHTLPPALAPEFVAESWKAEGKVTIREILQWYATEYTRARNPDYWVEEMNDQIHKFRKACCDQFTGYHHNHFMVIDDVRFENEAALVRANKGLLIRLDPYEEWNQYSDHPSETALDTYNFDIRVAPAYGSLSEVRDIVIRRIFGGGL